MCAVPADVKLDGWSEEVPEDTGSLSDAVDPAVEALSEVVGAMMVRDTYFSATPCDDPEWLIIAETVDDSKGMTERESLLHLPSVPIGAIEAAVAVAVDNPPAAALAAAREFELKSEATAALNGWSSRWKGTSALMRCLYGHASGHWCREVAIAGDESGMVLSRDGLSVSWRSDNTLLVCWEREHNSRILYRVLRPTLTASTVHALKTAVRPRLCEDQTALTPLTALVLDYYEATRA